MDKLLKKKKTLKKIPLIMQKREWFSLVGSSPLVLKGQ